MLFCAILNRRANEMPITAPKPTFRFFPSILIGTTVGIVLASFSLSLLWLVNGTPWNSSTAIDSLSFAQGVYSALSIGLKQSTFALVNLENYILISIKAASEEIIFRFLVFRKLLERYSFPIAAIASSTLFAALHTRSEMTVLSSFVSGLVFALLYTATGRLSSTVSAHVALNCFISAFSRTPTRPADAVTLFTDMSAATKVALLSPAALLCASAALLWLWERSNRQDVQAVRCGAKKRNSGKE